MTLDCRWLLATVLAALVHSAPATSQPVHPAPAASPDVPAGPASVIGRIVHETRPEAATSIDVLLYALSPDGSGGLRQGQTDAAGHFRFEGVSNAPDVVYLVGARAGDVPFGSRFTFAAGETEHRVELTVSDPIADTSIAEIGPAALRIDRGCTHLRVSHRHTLSNPGERVVFVREADRDEAEPILEVVLPAAAEGFEAELGRDGLVREGRRVRYWGPLYPGTQEFEFGYGLPVATTSLEVGLPGGAPRIDVLTPESALEVASDILVPAPETKLESRSYAVSRTGEIPPGGTVALSVTVPERRPSAIRTPRAELWLELDDAALEINERMEVLVDEADGAAESPGEPLLCVPLPKGALGLRFSGEMLAAGLRRDPSGELAIHGPLPAGSTTLAVSYRLPASSEGAELERRFDRRLPLLSVLVADNGVVPETERLHRRRSVRSDDRMFLHLEAFGIEPTETIALGLRRTPPRDADPSLASTGFAVLAGLAALGFLMAPLRGAADGAQPRAAAGADEVSELERIAFARALEDLEDDLETGKLSPEDHAALRAELRARAAAQLLRAPSAPVEPATDQLADCSACGAVPRPGDAFCARCGAKLDGTPPA